MERWVISQDALQKIERRIELSTGHQGPRFRRGSEDSVSLFLRMQLRGGEGREITQRSGVGE